MWSSTPLLFAHVFVILSFHTEHWDFEKLPLAFTACSFLHKLSYSHPVSSVHLMPKGFLHFRIPFSHSGTVRLGASFLARAFCFLPLAQQTAAGYIRWAQLCMSVPGCWLAGPFLSFNNALRSHLCCQPQLRSKTEDRRAPDSWPAALRAISCYFCLQLYAFVVVLVISFLFPISELKFPGRTLLSFCLWREVDEVSV